MKCSRCNRWMQIGLTLLATTFTTAVHAATSEQHSLGTDYNSPPPLVLPESSNEANKPSEDAQPKASGWIQKTETAPPGALPTVRVFLPGEYSPDNGVTEPAIAEPAITELAITEPAIAEPAITAPVITEPAITAPVITEPAIAKPTITELAITEPAITEPAPSLPEPLISNGEELSNKGTDAVNRLSSIEPVESQEQEPLPAGAVPTSVTFSPADSVVEQNSKVSQTPEDPRQETLLFLDEKEEPNAHSPDTVNIAEDTRDLNQVGNTPPKKNPANKIGPSKESEVILDGASDDPLIAQVIPDATLGNESSVVVPDHPANKIAPSKESEMILDGASDDLLIAQVIPDATLGNESSVVVPDQTVRGDAADLIDGGAVRGANIFHSFEEFNVNTGQRVYFSSPEGIDRILSRVTGNNVSGIDGVLGVDGFANLFLLNPNGILFGPNASLDVAGSFLATTANGFTFDDGVTFSAVNPDAPPILTMDMPPGLQYGTGQSGPVINGGNLAVGANESLTLTGSAVINTGTLTAEGGEVAIASFTEPSAVQLGEKGQIHEITSLADLQTPEQPNAVPIAPSVAEIVAGTDIALGLTLADTGEVRVMESGSVIPVESGNTIVAGTIDAANRNSNGLGGSVNLIGDRVALVDSAYIDVSGDGGGGVALVGGNYQGQGDFPPALRTYVGSNAEIRADAVTTGDGGRVIVWADQATHFTGDISAQGGSQEGDGGFVEVSGAESLAFGGEVNTQAVNGQMGSLLLDPANITISDTAPEGFTTLGAGDLSLADFFYGATEDQGQNSHLTPITVVDLLASNDLTLEATDTIAVNNNVDANSDNNLTLKASTIEVNNALLTQTGRGDIVLETPQSVGHSVMLDGGIVNTAVVSGTMGDGGDVRITTHDLTVQNGGAIITSTFGAGDSGLLQIDATGNLIVVGNGSVIASAAGPGAEGNGGGVTIATDNLAVGSNAEILSNTLGQGDSGLLQIDATGDIVVDGAGASIGSLVIAGAVGDSGGITITANNLLVSNSAGVTSATFGQGSAGLLQIDATGDIVVDGNGAFISGNVLPGAVGNSGGIFITTNDLSVRNGALVVASTLGDGNAGRIEIQATGNIVVDGEETFIESAVGPTTVGNSGGITINTQNLSVLNNAIILTDTFGQGDSGLLQIDATGNIVIDGEGTSIESAVLSGAVGNSGGMTINTQNLSVLNNAIISTNTFGQGNAGLLQIDAIGDISLGDGAIIQSVVGPGAIGNSRGIAIDTQNLSALNGSSISSNTLGQGNSGVLQINARGEVRVEGSGTAVSAIESAVGPNAVGNSSGIAIVTNNLSVLNDAGILSSTFGQGDAGLLQIDATGDIVVDGSGGVSITAIESAVGPNAVGRSGGLVIKASSLFVLNSAGVSSNTFSRGNAGLLQIDAARDIVVDGEAGIVSEVRPDAVGNSEGITITTNNLFVRNGAGVLANTSGQGDAGFLQIDARGDIVVDGSGEASFTSIESTVEPDAVGNSGGIVIMTNNLSINGAGFNAGISSGTFGQGDAGLLQIDATGDIVVNGEALINSRVQRDALGNSEGITITTNNLFVRNGAGITASTLSQGNSGLLQIHATGSIVVDGDVAFLASGVGVEATGNSSGLKITTNDLSVLNSAVVSASTRGEGDSGLLQIDATGDILVDGEESMISSAVDPSAVGNSEGLILTTNHLAVLNSGQVSAKTDGQGNAGSVQIQSRDNSDLLITLDDESLIEATTSNTFDGGNLQLNTPGVLTIQGPGTLTTETSGVGNAGDIDIEANTLVLEEGATATAQTVGEGAAGDVTVDAANSVLLTGEGTRLAAEAVNNSAAGNLIITTGKLDVTDNANVSISTQDGPGGDITLTLNDLAVVDSLIEAETENGVAGNLTVNTRENPSNSIVLSGVLPNNNPAGLSVESTGDQGQAGILRLHTHDLMVQDGADLSAERVRGNVNNEGDTIRITELDSLTIDNARISASTQRSGFAGGVTIEATDSVRFSGFWVDEDGNPVTDANGSPLVDELGQPLPAGVFVEGRGDGIALPLNITTGELIIENGAQASVSTENGQGGALNVTATERVQLKDGGLFARATNSGRAGQVNIATPNLSLSNGSIISATNISTSSEGVFLSGLDTLEILDSEISTSTQIGSAGSVQVSGREDAPVNSILLHGSEARIAARATGDGGNADRVDLNVLNLMVEDGAEITASNRSSRSEGVFLSNLEQLSVINGGQITASTGTGLAGSVQVNLEDGERPANAILVSGDNSRIAAEATENIGNAGNVRFNVQELTVQDGGEISTSTRFGEAGSVVISADTVLLNQEGRINAETDGGQGGNVELRVNETLHIQNGSEISATTQSGTGGSITVSEPAIVNVRNSQIAATAETAIGEAGAVNVNASESILLSGQINDNQRSGIFVSAQGGEAGALTLTTPTLSIRNGAELSVSNEESGDSGNLSITANTVSLRKDGQINAETDAGSGGSIDLAIGETLTLNNSRISATTNDGIGGSIILNSDEGNESFTNAVQLRNGSAIATTATGSGDAGRLRLNANSLTLNQSEINAATNTGANGNIRLNVDETLSLQNGSEISATTQSGTGGDIVIREVDTVRLRNSSISSSAQRGEAGDLSITASERITLSGTAEGRGGLLVESRQDKGGELRVQANELLVEEDADISASTNTGTAGDIIITIAESIRLSGDGTELAAQARRSGGTAGDVEITAEQVTVDNGAAILASNQDAPSGGSITLNGLETLDVKRGRISAETETGVAGNLSINAVDSIQLTDGAVLSVETGASQSSVSGDGRTSQGGNQGRSQERAQDRGQSRGDGRSPSRTAASSIPEAGNLSIATNRLTLEDGSRILVSSPNGQAGNILILGSEVELDNGSIRATTSANASDGNESANITIGDLDLLFIENNSLISAEALAGANGGNITLDAGNGFIIAPPSANSDLIANAIGGDGGRITIRALQLFGFQVNSGEFDDLRANQTSDISVSSTLGTDGVIAVDDLGIDPVQAAGELPTDTATPPLSQGCQAGSGSGEFTNAGRGGIHASPLDPLSHDVSWEDIQPSNQRTGSSLFDEISQQTESSAHIEAEAWFIDDKGNVVLSNEPEAYTTALRCQIQ
ncbi:MAG: filamentous hemagglutinin N-terminal domain-containing protein [Cyanobacteria bacterium P01_F01_bin.150]